MARNYASQFESSRKELDALHSTQQIENLDLVGNISYHAHMSVVLKQRVWTPQERLDQSRALSARQIWLKSTGPRTSEGKAKSSMNARKPDYDDRQAQKLEMRQIKAYLRLQKLFTDTLRFQIKHAETLDQHAEMILDMQLNFLENELSDLEHYMFGGLDFYQIVGAGDHNIIPFRGRPPS